MFIDPLVRRCPMPWTGGNRDVLIAFTAKGFESVQPLLRQELAACGFSLPGNFNDFSSSPLVGGLVPSGSPASPALPLVLSIGSYLDTLDAR